MSNRTKTAYVEAQHDGVRILTLDRPPVNALGRELVGDLADAVAELAGDEDARCVVVRTAGKHYGSKRSRSRWCSSSSRMIEHF